MDQGLWTRFQKGDKQAFSNIYMTHVDVLFLYGSKLCSNTNVVKDSIQDIFIDLFEHRNQLSEPNNIRYYLFKILKRTIFSKLKKAQKSVDLFDLNSLRFNAEYNYENIIIKKEIDNDRKKLMAKLLMELTAKQQEILYLRFTMGFSYLEISRILNIDHNSVRKQVYRAIKSLRESTLFKNHLSLIVFFSLLDVHSA